MKHFLFAVLVTACAIPTIAQTPSDDGLKNTLVTLEKQSWEAWKNRDAAFFRDFLSDDHLEVGPAGVAGKSAVVGMVGSPVCVVKSYEVDSFVLTRIDDNTALLTYHARQDTACRGVQVSSPAWATSLYVRRDNRWRNLLYQQTWK